jgi:hypothetical protein
MNERIVDIMVQAFNTCKKYDDEEPGLIKTTEAFYVFAELIIQECAKIADTAQAEDMGWDIGGIIREHFGVDE